MRTIQRLKMEAKNSARFRGHRLTPFKIIRISHEGAKIVAHAECRCCDCSVVVNTRPAPNEIDIGGDAVAINCATH